MEYKIILLGIGGVGKSAITIQFTKSHFVGEYDPTVEDTYRKVIDVDEIQVVLNILDTAGQEELSGMRTQYSRTGDGFLLVFSITEEKTFLELDALRNQILQIKDVDNFPMVVLGNKCDLEDQREVTKDRAQKQTGEWGVPYLETSAKEKINVTESFHQLVREIRTYTGYFESNTDNTTRRRSLCTLI
eukprot:TRINITY_DN4668_c0_g2_i2.p1 TRINITY_DN4668_c0_g2~~TRINITY_DN4668_c0_g2_i2.p1  ORF type:complete len:188 (-),score=40.84 TRINITY_DN4668_c0_g2_i2:63-626(-)